MDPVIIELYGWLSAAWAFLNPPMFPEGQPVAQAFIGALVGGAIKAFGIGNILKAGVSIGGALLTKRSQDKALSRSQRQQAAAQERLDEFQPRLASLGDEAFRAGEFSREAFDLGVRNLFAQLNDQPLIDQEARDLIDVTNAELARTGNIRSGTQGNLVSRIVDRAAQRRIQNRFTLQALLSDVGFKSLSRTSELLGQETDLLGLGLGITDSRTRLTLAGGGASSDLFGRIGRALDPVIDTAFPDTPRGPFDERIPSPRPEPVGGRGAFNARGTSTAETDLFQVIS